MWMMRRALINAHSLQLSLRARDVLRSRGKVKRTECMSGNRRTNQCLVPTSTETSAVFLISIKTKEINLKKRAGLKTLE